MRAFGILLAKELLEQWRTLRIAVVGGLFLVVGIGSPLLARFTPDLLAGLAGDELGVPIVLPDPTAADAVNQLLRNLGQFGALAAIVLAMGAVATEKERGTAALLLTTSVSRRAFLTAKAVAIGLVVAGATAAAVIVGAIYTAILVEPLDPGGWLGLTALATLMLLAYAAITFLARTLARSAAAAGGVGFLALIGLAIGSALPAIGPYLPPGLVGPAAAIATGGPVEALAGPVVAVALLIGASVGGAIVAFGRQEL
jgi:ABC-2 type transport system permease protein